MLTNWFKIYLNYTGKTKMFFLWNILGLAIGIASVLMVVVHLKEEYSYNRWITDIDQLYEVNIEMGEQGNSVLIPAGVGPSLMQAGEVESYCYFALEYIDFYGESRQEQGIVNKILNTQKTFFDFYNFDFIYGQPERVFNKELSVAISEQTAKRFFGEVNPIGDTLSLAHQKYVVNGVYRLNQKATIMPDVVIANIEWNNADSPSLWQENTSGLVVRISKEQPLENISKKVSAEYYEKRKQNKYDNDAGDKIAVKLSSLKEGRFDSKQTALLEGRSKIETVKLIFGSSLLIFFLAILNYISLNQANVLRRVKEFKIRRIIGASKRQIVGQIIFETVLNAVIALCLALVFVELSLPVYNNFLHSELQFEIGKLIGVLVLLLLAVICFGGVLPALYANYIALRNLTNAPFVKGYKGAGWRGTIVTVQVVIAFFFLIVGWIINNQVGFMQKQPLGFEGDNVYQVKLYTQQIRRKFYRNDKLVEALQGIKGVEDVSLSTISYRAKAVNHNYTAYLGLNKITDFVMEGVDDNYIQMLGFEHIAQANIAVDSLSTVVVNQQFVDKVGKRADEVVGEIISFDGNTYIVKGVINNFYRDGFDEVIKPMVLFNWKDIDFLPYSIESISIRIAEGIKEETLERIQAFWLVNVDYEYPFEPILVKEQFAQTYQKVLSQRDMFVLWIVAVVLISLFGLYAVISFVVERRLKEIVIRKVLGADTGQMLKQLLLPYVIMVIVGYALVVYPTYWLMNKWLMRFSYRQEIELLPFIYAFVLLLGLILLILTTKVLRATRINVLKYIKYE